MARKNRISAEFTMDTGDGANGFTEQYGLTPFDSGDAVKIDGTVTNSAATYTIADYGMAQADGIFVQNRSSSHALNVVVNNGSNIVSIDVAANGIFMVRIDPALTAVVSVALTGNAAGNEFVLILAE